MSIQRERYKINDLCSIFPTGTSTTNRTVKVLLILIPAAFLGLKAVKEAVHS